MARPTTKKDLVKAADENFGKMWDCIDSMTEAEQIAPFDFEEGIGKEAHWARDKNMRDVLVHLYEWHQLLLNWVKGNQEGDARPFLPKPYNWKTYGQMNVEFWERHQSTSYEDSRTMLVESHREVMDMIEGFSDEELFERKHFSWTGASTLGSYCVSATASHYDWAIKKIKAHMKRLKKT